MTTRCLPESKLYQKRRVKEFLPRGVGGTITGQFVVLAYLVRHAVARGESWALKAAWVSMLVWFIPDSIVTTLHGAYFNLFQINFPSMLVMGALLLWVGRRAREGLGSARNGLVVPAGAVGGARRVSDGRRRR